MKESYWVNHSGTLTVRNLYKESFNWNREKFVKRDGLDLYNYMWQENFDFNDFGAAGCMYEVGGLRVDPGDVVVDIGANIGMWSVLAASQGASEVFSFEPVRLNYVCLCLNSSGYPVKPYNLALGDRQQMMSIKVHDNMGFCGNKVLPDADPVEDIMIVTMDWLFDIGLLKRIDLLKIDVEGTEDQILFNISKERMSKINKITMEYHHNCPVHHEDIIKYLAGHGIKVKFRLDCSDHMKVITFTR